MSRVPSPGPHLVCALPPWEHDLALPFEPEIEPHAKPCRRCLRVDSDLEARLIAALEVVGELEELLEWLREEHALSSRYREEAEHEAAALRGLIAEFDGLAVAHERRLVAARQAVAASRERRVRAEQAVAEERARASRLAAELKRAKTEGTRSEGTKSERARSEGTKVEGTARRAAAEAHPEDVAALAFAATEAAESDGRLLALEAELGRERARVQRYARYVEALEARLRDVAESDEPGDRGGAGDSESIRLAAAGASRR